jgi:HEAT repeat protein
MRSSRGRRAALAFMGLGTLVIVIAVIASWGWIVESWWIHALATPDDARRHEAEDELLKMRSVRAIGAMFELYSDGQIQIDELTLFLEGMAWSSSEGEVQDDREAQPEDAPPTISPPVRKKLKQVLISGTDHKVRFAAARFLADRGIAGRLVRETIFDLVRNGERAIRGEVIRWLIDFESMASFTGPGLALALEDPDEELRSAAIEGGTGTPQLLKIALEDPVPALRIKAKQTLRVVPVAAFREGVPALMGCLRSPETWEQVWAMEVLGRIGPEARAAVRALIELTRGEFEIQLAALSALRTIGAGPQGVPRLLEILKDGNELNDPRELAAAGLAGADPQSEEVAAALLEVLEDEISFFLRASAAHALAKMKRIEVIPILRKSLTHEDVYLRAESAEALGEMGDLARDAVPDLEKLLADEDEDLRRRAEEALWRIRGSRASPGPHSGPGIEDEIEVELGAICSAAQDADSLRPATTLVRLGKSAVPALIEVLRKGPSVVHWFCRARAARILGDIGPDAREALPALEALAGDEDQDEEVSRAAAEALAKIRR